MTKRILLKAGSLLLILALCFSVVGCGGDEKDYKLGFLIKIYGHGEELYPYTYVLNSEMDTLHTELDYTGEKCYVSFDSWNIPLHPEKEYEEWHAACDMGSGDNKCVSNLYFIEEDGSLTPIKDKALKEKGHYVFVCEATEPSTLWTYQSKKFYIDVI